MWAQKATSHAGDLPVVTWAISRQQNHNFQPQQLHTLLERQQTPLPAAPGLRLEASLPGDGSTTAARRG